MIELSKVNCLFENGGGIRDINLKIEDGNVIAVIGKSGSGKSTLLKCINLLERPDSGHININGTDLLFTGTKVEDVRKRIGMVFQEMTLFSHLLVIENVMMGPRDLLGLSKEEAFARAKKYLQKVGLGEKMFEYPSSLSSGQQQRAEIARCLAMEPEILLLDDPTGILDVTSKGEVRALINQLASEGMTMMITSSDLRYLRKIADWVIFMEDGIIYEQGTPEQIFDHPYREHTRDYINQLRSLSYDIVSKDFDLYELNNLLENFGRDYFMSRKSIRNLELIVEELIYNNILSHTDHIELDIRFYEVTSSLYVFLKYEGEPFNPFENDDEDVLSMLLVRGLTENETYKYDDINNLNFEIKVETDE